MASPRRSSKNFAWLIVHHRKGHWPRHHDQENFLANIFNCYGRYVKEKRTTLTTDQQRLLLGTVTIRLPYAWACGGLSHPTMPIGVLSGRQQCYWVENWFPKRNERKCGAFFGLEKEKLHNSSNEASFCEKKRRKRIMWPCFWRQYIEASIISQERKREKMTMMGVLVSSSSSSILVAASFLSIFFLVLCFSVSSSSVCGSVRCQKKQK